MNKLSENDYWRLQAQFDKTPHPDDGFMPSGEHYILTSLLNELGYYPHSREELYKTTEKLLSKGYTR